MATRITKKTNPLKVELEELGKSLQTELEDLGKSLQHMGRTFADATTKRLTGAADETLGAAEKALTAARTRVKTTRTQLRRSHATRPAAR
jgi:hypothetical protein